MKKPVKVVILLTEESHLFISHNKIDIIYQPHLPLRNKSEGLFPQHLYITVSQDIEKPKNGDWCIYKHPMHKNSMVTQIQNWNHSRAEKSHAVRHTEGYGVVEGYRKVIATTDPNLTHPSKVQYGNMTMIDHNKDGSYYSAINVEVEFSLSREELIQRGVIVPQLQESFLKEFIANPVRKWEVEYEVEECGYDNGQILYDYDNSKLKLNQDNTINISSAEEKMYSREEVIEIGKEISKLYNVKDFNKLKDWAKYNLN
jgi:hypothetical protein